MLTGITTINSMITVGINLHIELFVQLNKMFGIFGTVLEVYIIISHSMYKQKVAMEFVCPCKGGCGFISFGIFFGSTHKAFRVDRIIKSPVRIFLHHVCADENHD